MGADLMGGRVLPSGRYHATVTRSRLIEHLVAHSVRTDGPFVLSSGAESDWYLDARQTTFDGNGARMVAEAVLDMLAPDVEAVGGMTMGADPIAVATAVVAAERGIDLKAFSVRKAEKAHGVGGRLVGPVHEGMGVAILEDTTTSGSAAQEAVDVVVDAGLKVLQVLALVDRSGGVAVERFADLGIPFDAVVTPLDLGVGE